MLPKPIEYRFTIDDESYLLVEWNRGGERRLRADYALAIAAAPDLLESIDGANLYAEAVARECLKEAPPVFWQELPAPAAHNGTPRPVVSLEHIPRRLWEQFRKEVNAFLLLLFPTEPAALVTSLAGGAGDQNRLAPPENVPAVFRGRAE
jgi:hypothetical protein